MPTFDHTTYKTQEKRSIPIILLLDVSSSMEGGKIDSLNAAVSEMIDSFAHEMGEFSTVVAVIPFGEQVDYLYKPPYKKSSEIQWDELVVSGLTPMGEALKKAKAMIEDKNTTKGNWYRPTVILVSDGKPNDSWEQPMDDFINSGRSTKCDRMAMAIGNDADEDVLKRFIKGTSNPLFYAHNAGDVRKFFKRVVMSVSYRSKSSDPNVLPSAPPLDPSNSSKGTKDYF
jgi:uncharacterized protein YegL